MPFEVMRIGMVCAAQYIQASSSDWHRCIITGFSDGFVQVLWLSLTHYLIVITLHSKQDQLLQR